jgi:hypothetical protein
MPDAFDDVKTCTGSALNCLERTEGGETRIVWVNYYWIFILMHGLLAALGAAAIDRI